MGSFFSFEIKSFIIPYQNLVMNYNRKEKGPENSNPCEVFSYFAYTGY